MKKLFKFYIFSNIHVALAALAMVMVTNFKWHLSDVVIPLFVFFSVIVSYNFIRFYEIKTKRLQWFSNWFFKHKAYLFIISIFSTSVLLYIVFFTSFRLHSLLILLPFALMTLFYAVPLGSVRGKIFSFRNYPFIKIFSIAFAWAGVTVLFPVYHAEIELVKDVYIEFSQRFLILIPITIPFDIRDVAKDEEKLYTLPQFLGVKKSKAVGAVLILIFVLLEYLKDTHVFMGVTILIAFITFLFLYFSTENKSRIYTGFWVESIPIFWWILLVLLEK